MTTDDEMSNLEIAVIDKFLEADDATFALLREQVRLARVVERVFTGVGFRITLQMDPSARAIVEKPSLQLSNVAGELEGLEHGAGFVLFIEKGLIKRLEGFSYDEPWPVAMGKFRVYEITRQGNHS